MQGTNCMVHKAPLVSKTIPKIFNEKLSVVLSVVLAPKLKLCSQQANNGNFASFHRLSEIAGNDFE